MNLNRDWFSDTKVITVSDSLEVYTFIDNCSLLG